MNTNNADKNGVNEHKTHQTFTEREHGERGGGERVPIMSLDASEFFVF